MLEIIEKTFEASKLGGLTANLEKTRIMSNTTEKDFVIRDIEIKTVNEFKYLGKIVSFELSDEKEVDARISSAWRTFWSMKRFFKGYLPIQHKKRLMNCCVLPALTYGSATWKLTETLKERLAVAQRSMERCMLNIKRSDHVSNEKIRKITKIKNVRGNP